MTDMSGWRHSTAPFAELADRVRLAFEGWWRRVRLGRELDMLRQRGELERTLSDSGISPSDVPRLMRAHPGAPQQLDEMMRRLGIDRATLPADPRVIEGLRAIEWRCGDCADWRRCRAWLASREPAGSHRDFCPNAEALDELRRAALR